MSVQVKIELGHKASIKDRPTDEGYTHDWTVFVRGAENSPLQYFVDKVVFHLHESFPKPKRIIKEPPYQVSESGYAGFMMPIEVYFKNKEEPKKVCFEYDLYLCTSEDVKNFRVEKLTFNNPLEDFRRKLLKAGGVAASSGSSSGSASLQTQAVPAQQHNDDLRAPAYGKSIGIAEKKPRSHASTKEPTKAQPLAPKPSAPFTDIFGTPIKAKSSPDPASKSKDNTHSSQQKQSKVSPLPATPAAVSTTKDVKSTPKENYSSDVKDVKVPKVVKSEKEKSTSKRPAPVNNNNQNSHGPSEKKKRHVSVSSENLDKPLDGNKVKDVKEKKEKPKIKVSSHSDKKKEKEKSKSKVLVTSASQKEISKSPKPISQPVKQPPPPPPPPPPPIDTHINETKSNDIKVVKSQKFSTSSSSSPSLSLSDASEDIDNAFDSIPTTVPDVENVPSPVSSNDRSPPCLSKEKPTNSHEVQNNNSYEEKAPKPSTKIDKNGTKFKIDSKSKSIKKSSPGSENSSSKENREHSSNTIVAVEDKSVKQNKVMDPTYLNELMELQQKIMSLNDQHLLQRIVDVIEKTGRFQMTSSSFDFDLCSLDQSTVRKLKHCLTM